MGLGSKKVFFTCYLTWLTKKIHLLFTCLFVRNLFETWCPWRKKKFIYYPFIYWL